MFAVSPNLPYKVPEHLHPKIVNQHNKTSPRRLDLLAFREKVLQSLLEVLHEVAALLHKHEVLKMHGEGLANCFVYTDRIEGFLLDLGETFSELVQLRAEFLLRASHVFVWEEVGEALIVVTHEDVVSDRAQEFCGLVLLPDSKEPSDASEKLVLDLRLEEGFLKLWRSALIHLFDT